MRARHVLAAFGLALASAASAQVPVRYPEGTVHGFLELRTEAGALLAHGDLLQTVDGDTIESRMVFHFADTGTVFEEAVRYTQDKVFRMRQYHLVQRGAPFPFAIDATLEANGSYTLRTTSKAKDATEQSEHGTLDLPADAANGLVIVFAKNVPTNASTHVHIVAFTPTPRVIGLELQPVGSEPITIGGHTEHAVTLALRPKLGALLKLLAEIAGKAPPDSKAWIDTTGVPAFVRFEGPMYLGAVWTLTLATPTSVSADR